MGSLSLNPPYGALPLSPVVARLVPATPIIFIRCLHVQGRRGKPGDDTPPYPPPPAGEGREGQIDRNPY
jgi:hypothetical protein